jgi:hypothetical protein
MKLTCLMMIPGQSANLLKKQMLPTKTKLLAVEGLPRAGVQKWEAQEPRSPGVQEWGG